MKPRRVGPRARTCSGPNKKHKKQSKENPKHTGTVPTSKIGVVTNNHPTHTQQPTQHHTPGVHILPTISQHFPCELTKPHKEKKTSTVTRHPPPTGWRPPRICILRATNLRANETASTHRPTGTRHNILKQTPLCRRRKWVVCPEPSILEPFAQHTSHPKTPTIAKTETSSNAPDYQQTIL